jgi:hypothetical protein
MRKAFYRLSPSWPALWLVVSLLCLGDPARANGPGPGSAELLLARQTELAPQLADNQFHRPLVLESTESSSRLTGDIYAVVDYDFAVVNRALNDPAHWCDALILHLNIKYCHALTSEAGSVLVVSIGKKYDQPLSDAYRVDFSYRVAEATATYFDVRLDAERGPMGTSDYRIQLEAVSVPSGKTFLHLAYSYGYGYLGHLAMQGYLFTTGRNKVGFTNVGTASSGQPDYIGGVRGMVERNTMRYYLAIDAYLSALSLPPGEQLEKRLQEWFTSTEIYSRQLHELDRATYVDMKRHEYERQQQPL